MTEHSVHVTHADHSDKLPWSKYKSFRSTNSLQQWCHHPIQSELELLLEREWKSDAFTVGTRGHASHAASFMKLKTKRKKYKCQIKQKYNYRDPECFIGDVQEESLQI